MDEQHRDSNKIFENINNHIDDAESLLNLTPFLKVIPLDTIKQCIKERIKELQHVITQTSSNNTFNDPICSTQYNEMRKLALSISPINDVLSTDLLIYIISFLTTDTNSFYRRKEKARYYQFLPTLSKSFQTIMNNAYFYHSNYPLYIDDIGYKQKKKSDHSMEVHISADHNSKQLEIKRMKIKKNKCTKTIKRVPMLIPTKVFDSSLPWRCRSKVIISGDIKDSKTANPNILNILSETNPKCLYLNNSIPVYRLKTYPSFTNVIYLCIVGLEYMSSTDPKIWLNSKQFPSLKILSMNIPSKVGSHRLNALINSLDLCALHLTDCHSNTKKIDLKITSSKLQFICLGTRSSEHHFIRTLDLTECSDLIGIHCNIQIPFSSIIWNKECALKFINIFVSDKEINIKYSMEWYKAYEEGNIFSDIVIGNCFFKTKPKTLSTNYEYDRFISVSTEYVEDDRNTDSENKYQRRRSMEFKDIMHYIGNNELHHFYKNKLFDDIYFIQHIAKNFPRVRCGF